MMVLVELLSLGLRKERNFQSFFLGHRHVGVTNQNFLSKETLGTSLVVKWLRLCASMQETQVQSLV